MTSYCLLLALMVAADAQLLSRSVRQESDDSIQMTLCGRNLAEARKVFCLDNGYLLAKKSGRRHHINEIVPYEEGRDGAPSDNFEKMLWPWMMEHARANGLSLRRPKRDGGVGLVDECCFKSCTLNELLSYC